MSERLGKCLGCGKASGDQYCDACEKRAEAGSDKIIVCENCADAEVSIEGDVCEHCLDELHADRDCPDGCHLCESARDHAEAMKEQAECQKTTEHMERSQGL